MTGRPCPEMGRAPGSAEKRRGSAGSRQVRPQTRGRTRPPSPPPRPPTPSRRPPVAGVIAILKDPPPPPGVPRRRCRGPAARPGLACAGGMAGPGPGPGGEGAGGLGGAAAAAGE